MPRTLSARPPAGPHFAVKWIPSNCFGPSTTRVRRCFYSRDNFVSRPATRQDDRAVQTGLVLASSMRYEDEDVPRSESSQPPSRSRSAWRPAVAGTRPTRRSRSSSRRAAWPTICACSWPRPRTRPIAPSWPTPTRSRWRSPARPTQAAATIESKAAALSTRLQSLGYAPELHALQDFIGHFGAYRKLDHDVLTLAVENTNLKAQRLSFGPVRETADGFRDALHAAAQLAPAKDRCRVDGLVARAELAVREIQILQAPHIAEPDEAAMTKLEKEMADRLGGAREALENLGVGRDRRDGARSWTRPAQLSLASTSFRPSSCASLAATATSAHWRWRFATRRSWWPPATEAWRSCRRRWRRMGSAEPDSPPSPTGAAFQSAIMSQPASLCFAMRSADARAGFYSQLPSQKQGTHIA